MGIPSSPATGRSRCGGGARSSAVPDRAPSPRLRLRLLSDTLPGMVGRGCRSVLGYAVFAAALAVLPSRAADPVSTPVAPVQITPQGDASTSMPPPAAAPVSAAPKPTSSSGFASSPASGKQSSMMDKMFQGKGDLSQFNTQRSVFDGKNAPFDMKQLNLIDQQAKIGGRDVYAPMLDSFDKRIDTPQAGVFQGMSPMSSAATTAMGSQASVFDSKRAPGFDKSVSVPAYKGPEADKLNNPKPFAQGMGIDDGIIQRIRNGGSYDATISLEEVRDLINKDVKGASLQIPIPAIPPATTATPAPTTAKP